MFYEHELEGEPRVCWASKHRESIFLFAQKNADDIFKWSWRMQRIRGFTQEKKCHSLMRVSSIKFHSSIMANKISQQEDRVMRYARNFMKFCVHYSYFGFPWKQFVGKQLTTQINSATDAEMPYLAVCRAILVPACFVSSGRALCECSCTAF